MDVDENIDADDVGDMVRKVFTSSRDHFQVVDGSDGLLDFEISSFIEKAENLGCLCNPSFGSVEIQIPNRVISENPGNLQNLLASYTDVDMANTLFDSIKSYYSDEEEGTSTEGNQDEISIILCFLQRKKNKKP